MRRIGRSASILVLVVAACSSAREDSRVAIDTKLVAPRTLLAKADKLEVRVLEGTTRGDVGCDATSGALTNESAGKEIARQELGDSGCASGIKFCGNLSIEKSDVMRVFSATAKNGSAVLAVGCAAAKIDQDNVPLTIQMFRFLEPANCGDGIVQPTEQCEPPGSAVCDSECHSKEVLLSTGSSGNKTDTGGPGDKADPFFLWPSGSGTGGRFLAFFTDKKTGTSNNSDVGIRAMSESLAALSSPPALASGSIFMSSGAGFPPDPAPFRQSMPQAASLAGSTWVVFMDDNSPGSAGFGLDIHLRALDDVLQAPAGDAMVINGSTGEAGIQSAPSIAAGKAKLFIAWEDSGSGKISGRTLAPPSTLGSQIDISTGNANAQPSVAPTGDEFVTVWKSGTGIRFRKVNDAGVPQGSDAAVSEGGGSFDRPRVASLSDGRFAVAWISDGHVFVQRFDAKGSKVAGDQATPIDDGGDSSSGVAIAGMSAAGGSFVVAWIDGATNHARARLLGGSSGFLFNNVDGQATSFQASVTDGRTRANAAVAVGGAGPFIAIGWEDKGAAPNAGIVARRFPVPTE